MKKRPWEQETSLIAKSTLGVWKWGYCRNKPQSPSSQKTQSARLKENLEPWGFLPFPGPFHYLWADRRLLINFLNITALLSIIHIPYNSPHVNHINHSMISVYSQLRNYHHDQFQSIFITPKRKPVSTSHHSPFLNFPSPGHSLWICLIWKLHRKGIIYCIVFCHWLLSLVMFWRFIHVSILHFLLQLNNVPLYGYILLYPLISWWNLDCFHFLAIMHDT